MKCFSCGDKAQHICAVTEKAVCDTCWGDSNATN